MKHLHLKNLMSNASVKIPTESLYVITSGFLGTPYYALQVFDSLIRQGFVKYSLMNYYAARSCHEI